MKKLPIHNRNKEVVAYTLVDDEDFLWASKHQWRLVIGKRNLYVARAVRKETFYLHRLIMGVKSRLDIDHKNHDSLDNRKSNLRICTRSDNLQNSRKHIGKMDSPVKGVTREPNGKWRFQRMRNGIRETKRFETQQQAEIYAAQH